MQNPFNRFDKVFCLNLADRQDRWEICLENFNKYEINNWERFEGQKVVKGVYEDFSDKRIGQIGCALSFCRLIDHCINQGYESVLFLEDDFEFTKEPEELSNKLNKCFDELPKDWDAFYLGANVIDHFYSKPLEKYSDNLHRLISGYALHSVAFSRQGLLNVKSFFNNKENWGLDLINQYEAIDVFFAQHFHPNYQCFISNELLATQQGGFSTIESTFCDFARLMEDRFNYFKSKL